MSFQNLYLHVPFCTVKCDYCAFYSEAGAATARMEDWLSGMLRALEEHRAELTSLHTIYIGGGTPSSLPAPLLERFLAGVHANCGLIPGGEWSMEANPETVTPEKAAISARYVNRISMGVQSFQPDLLRAVGRRSGDPSAAGRAVRLFRAEGLDNLGFDLMYALPGQTLSSWRNDLARALDLGIRHLSAYSLTPEEGTPFAAREYEPSDALSQEMWQCAGEFLAARGMPRYEISNYAAPGFEAEHNCRVWHGETYLGLGPAASGFDGIRRWTEPSPLVRWLRGEPPEFDDIPRGKRLREIFLMGLRTVRGWAPGEFRTATGDGDPAAFEPELAAACADGMLETGPDGAVRPTVRGLTFWNEIALALL